MRWPLELAMTLHSSVISALSGVSSGGDVVFFAHQFVARLCPIRLGKFVRVALIDHGNFSGASFHFLG